MHDQRQAHAEHELDRDGDDGDQRGVEDALPPQVRRQDRLVVRQPDEARLVREAQVDLLHRQRDRVEDRIDRDEQHRDHGRRTQHQPELALGARPVADRGLGGLALADRDGGHNSPSRLTAFVT
jgi:hypothetical protein